MITRRVLFFVMYALAALLALATGSAIFYFILAAMTGMLFISFLSLLLVRLRFSVKEEITPLKTEAGAEGDLSILLANPYLFPFPQLEVEYVLPGPDGGIPYSAAFSVLPLQRIRIHEAMDLPCRGIYPVGLKMLMVYDVFGLFRLKLPYERITRQAMPCVTVLPRLSLPDAAAFSAMESPSNTEGAARATEDTSSPDSVRSYRPGDPVKRMHWKLSARQGQLMVRTYEPAAVSDALIYLDTAAPSLDAKEAWYASDVLTGAAVSLAARILEDGIPVRLIYLKNRRIEHRLTHLDELPALRRDLAALELSGGRSLRTLLTRESAPLTGSRCAYVLTRELTGSGVDLLAALSQAGIELRVALCRGTDRKLPDDMQSLYLQLQKRQIPSAVLSHDTSLAAALAALL